MGISQAPEAGVKVMEVDTLEIIEPNLRGPSGHYAEFVSALSSGAGKIPVRLRVHAHPEADPILGQLDNVELPNGPGRVNGLLGEWRTLYRLMRQRRGVLVLTATAKHAFLCSLFCLFPGVEPDRLVLYFHWKETRPGQRLMHWLSHRARRGSLAITPIPKIAESLKSAGWSRVACLPYPAIGPGTECLLEPFSKLMMAGAARLNKGLKVVAGLAEAWALQPDRAIPLQVQVSTKHHGRHGQKEKPVVDRLVNCGYRGLELTRSAPGRAEYFEAFRGALVLAPYDRERFAHGVSGIVLDALLSGAPVVATAGTWAGHQVERFGAGAVLDTVDVPSLERAIDECLADWPRISANALRAAQTLRTEHDPVHLLRMACPDRQ